MAINYYVWWLGNVYSWININLILNNGLLIDEFNS